MSVNLSPISQNSLVNPELLSALLNAYHLPLEQKHIFDEQALAQLIQIDVEKITYALEELENRDVASLMGDFLQSTPEQIDKVLAKLHNGRLYHVGLESNLPLELLQYLFKYPIANLNPDLAGYFDISRSLVFPASHAFQQRVQAYTEILRIWLHHDSAKPMLELFDIHRPIDLKRLQINHQKDVRDNIWHYAIYVREEGLVEELHRYFIEISRLHPQYQMPFSRIIRNKNDRSVLTKIINKAAHLEIEFVTGSFVTGPIPKPNNIETTSN